tara:strand:+ start:435 stop:746 length:312 start_codon:yes stop_codon:yes gene_type:complete
MFAVDERVTKNYTRPRCKHCERVDRTKKERDGFTSVYYLPKEHYVGMTGRVKKRMAAHRSAGKNTRNYKILRVFDNEIEAHLYETQLHWMGFFGFQFRSNTTK